MNGRPDHILDADFLKGGPGSGNYGHAGRPGERGGSGKGTGGPSLKDAAHLANVKSVAEKLGVPEVVANYLIRTGKIGVHAPEPPRVTASALEASGTHPGRTFPGQCYDQAARYVAWDNDAPDMKLIHGTISDGTMTIGHAWAETPSGLVFDGTTQAFYKKEDYYRTWKAVAERTFTKEQANANMLKYRHFGPWHHTAGMVNGLKGPKDE